MQTSHCQISFCQNFILLFRATLNGQREPKRVHGTSCPEVRRISCSPALARTEIASRWAEPLPGALRLALMWLDDSSCVGEISVRQEVVVVVGVSGGDRWGVGGLWQTLVLNS